MRAESLARRYISHVRIFGFSRGVLLAAHPPNRAVVTKWDASPHPIWIRPGTSDLATFKEVLLDNEYAFALLKSPTTIVDIGANIGLASIWFAVHYPEARILSVEAERSNYELLTRNVAPFANVTPLHAALWSRSATLAVHDPNNDGVWAFRTTALSSEHSNEDGEYGTVEGLTGSEIIGRSGFGRVDLLKIDIEGAEQEVFADPGSKEWLENVDAIAIELHDRFQPGCSRAFFNRVQEFDVELTNGNNTFFVSRSCLHSA